MKRLFMVMMQGLVCVFVMMFIGACLATDDEAEEFVTEDYDGIGDPNAEDDGNGPDNSADIDQNYLPLEHMAPPPVYHLPFMSGETYTATTYTAVGYSHVAWDFNKPGDKGEPIIATASGVVQQINDGCADPGRDAQGRCVTCSCGGGFGNFVRIDHDGDSYDSIYAHLETSQIFVRVGQWVERGQAIGRLGSSGNSSGDHLHYEVRDGNNNPIWPDFISTYGTGGLTVGLVYTSLNQGKFDSQRNASGAGNVGNQTTTNATRVHADGFSLTYSGGAWGENTMYYEARGCGVVPYCTAYNNTNYAWDVRGAIRTKYFAIGGPSSNIKWPTGNEYAWSNGQRQNFKCGYIYWNRVTNSTTATFTGCP